MKNVKLPSSLKIAQLVSEVVLFAVILHNTVDGQVSVYLLHTRMPRTRTQTKKDRMAILVEAIKTLGEVDVRAVDDDMSVITSKITKDPIPLLSERTGVSAGCDAAATEATRNHLGVMLFEFCPTWTDLMESVTTVQKRRGYSTLLTLYVGDSKDGLATATYWRRTTQFELVRCASFGRHLWTDIYDAINLHPGSGILVCYPDEKVGCVWTDADTITELQWPHIGPRGEQIILDIGACAATVWGLLKPAH